MLHINCLEKKTNKSKKLSIIRLNNINKENQRKTLDFQDKIVSQKIRDKVQNNPNLGYQATKINNLLKQSKQKHQIEAHVLNKLSLKIKNNLSPKFQSDKNKRSRRLK